MKFGETLLAACARNGTYYCDLTGEAIWVRKMIDKYEELAISSRAKLVHCCGFDSIPSDLGCFMIAEHMKRKHGKQTNEIKCIVDKLKGGASGGTFDSMFQMMDYAWKNGTKELDDVYLINPTSNKPDWDGPDQKFVRYDPDFKVWTAPFIMAKCNTRVVRRSNALLQNQYGTPFRYSEVSAFHGNYAIFFAAIFSIGLFLFSIFAYFPFTRKFVQKVVPKPGEGPSKQVREAGSFRLKFIGKNYDTKTTVIKGEVFCPNADPGYKGTAVMLGETALCLALDQRKIPESYGSLTPASACGSALIARLNQAGIEFSIK
jgi:short subunit dehydrogenase-like uncharacterized protein